MILEIIYKESAEKIITENDLPSARLRFEIAQFSVAEKSLADGVARFSLTVFLYCLLCKQFHFEIFSRSFSTVHNKSLNGLLSPRLKPKTNTTNPIHLSKPGNRILPFKYLISNRYFFNERTSICRKL